MQLLEGKRALVVGVANKRSIAWGIARQLHRHGATLCLTYQNERFKKNLENLASDLDPRPMLAPLDISDDDQLEALLGLLRQEFDGLEIVVHSVAHAKREDLQGNFTETSRDGFHFALEVSAYSLISLTRTISPMLSKGASIMAITHLGAERVIPNYNIMGVAKASLEATVKYLAGVVGPERDIRVNAISAGPVKTLAASGVKSFGGMMDAFMEKAPLRRPMDVLEIGGVAVFLASDLSSAVTGGVIFADHGYHILGI